MVLISKVDKTLVDEIPFQTPMGKVYMRFMRLALSTLHMEEDDIDGMI